MRIFKKCILHRYTNQEGGGEYISNFIVEWCCKKLKSGTSEKSFRIACGGIYFMTDDYTMDYWMKFCPFCGAKIIIKTMKVSDRLLRDITHLGVIKN